MRIYRYFTGTTALRYLPIYIGELLIIFLGITLSWWFEEWRQDKQDLQREALHLTNLRSNLDT
ncbi:MAG: hypothetical protein RL161_186, partial [Bacteroidota bacterium]